MLYFFSYNFSILRILDNICDFKAEHDNEINGMPSGHVSTLSRHIDVDSATAIAFNVKSSVGTLNI